MKTCIPRLAAALAAAFLALASAGADVVYQDNFDNDGLATNTGIGGGLVAYDRQGGPWLDNGVLDSNRNGNNDRGNAISINAFDLTGGFTLEVTYEIDDVTTIDANRAIIGLIDSTDVPATQTNTTYITDFLNRDLNMYGIGLNLTVQNATQGLNFADGTDLVGLSNAQTISTGTHTCVLTVDSDSNWSYSIDGAPATTGAVPGGFNFATDYQFVTYMQDNYNHLKIHSVTVTSAAASAPLALKIHQSGGNLDFEWNSVSGMQYDLLSHTDLSTNPATWLPYNDGVNTYEDLLTNNLSGVLKIGPVRFFALREEEIPPLFEEAFDVAGPGLPAGWVSVDATTVWDVGDPSGLPNLQNGDGTNCVGTNVVAGNYANEVATVTLTSPPVAIPAGGATLSFRQYIDSNAPGDVGAVRLLDATDTEIVEGDFPVTGIDGVETGWSSESYPLPPSAAGQSVKVVFEFATDADGLVYNGFYIDDVVVTPTTP